MDDPFFFPETIFTLEDVCLRLEAICKAIEHLDNTIKEVMEDNNDQQIPEL